jgi:hypothetical protein
LDWNTKLVQQPRAGEAAALKEAGPQLDILQLPLEFLFDRWKKRELPEYDMIHRFQAK